MAAAQYTFTHKQYTEQHKETEYKIVKCGIGKGGETSLYGKDL